ncbi:uncharacterized protein APUU_20425S [Aspergillus puulaauensis]|uniref:Uncharacterized protein n=1 Tax=Aspergillus puulaauensis TaxID=1220207 RepID=A0A7R7XEZ9_9EURO|nr:uncharacterized protein APUU_20425S [Aspergillus puulaauensis]BCS19993.1 hypothetical protein APUU_20425S [Aspergillus puulaauensis]
MFCGRTWLLAGLVEIYTSGTPYYNFCLALEVPKADGPLLGTGITPHNKCIEIYN